MYCCVKDGIQHAASFRGGDGIFVREDAGGGPCSLVEALLAYSLKVTVNETH
jgi:hypothetical protein